MCSSSTGWGAHITAPGINLPALQAQFGQLFGGTLFGVYDMFVGGGLSRATIFALGIMPYISASIMFQLLAAVFPTIEKLQKEGEEGRKKITQWTRYVTVVLCILQGYGYSVFVGSIEGAVVTSDFIFTLSTVVTLTVGGVFVMWLGEQITEHGIGNGMSLLIFFSIIEGFPSAVVRTWEAMMVGEIGVVALLVLVAVIVGVTGGVVSMTMGARQIPVQIPRKVVGRGRIQEGQKSYVPIRVNASGVMPIIFAQSFHHHTRNDRSLLKFAVLPRPGEHVPARQLALLRDLRAHDRLLHLLLHGDHLHPRRSRREPKKARVHSYPA